jgi:CRP/FNR family transcriptional regulator, cyclic AMP receptor protein
MRARLCPARLSSGVTGEEMTWSPDAARWSRARNKGHKRQPPSPWRGHGAAVGGSRRLADAGVTVTGAPAFGRLLRAQLPDGVITVRLPAKATLYTCGQPDDHLYLVDGGQLRAQTFSESGKSCLTAIYGPDDVVGESCLVQPARTEMMTALSPIVVRRIPRAKFVQQLSGPLLEDWLAYQALKMLAQQQLITHLVTLNAEQRLASVLLSLAAKFGSGSAGKIRLGNRLTHEEFAQMVGTTRSRIGYFFKLFRQSGLVQGCGGDLVIDERGLSTYLMERGGGLSH